MWLGKRWGALEGIYRPKRSKKTKTTFGGGSQEHCLKTEIDVEKNLGHYQNR